MKAKSPWEREHKPWCAFVISVNNGGPFWNRCDCRERMPRPKKQKVEVNQTLFASTS